LNWSYYNLYSYVKLVIKNKKFDPSDKPEQTEAAEEKKMKPDDKMKQKSLSKVDEAVEKTNVQSNNNESGNCYW